jgi:hypothetical protein
LPEQHEDLDIKRQNNANGPHRGPIHETIIDFVDGEIDIGAFTCPDMTETEKISQATLPLNNSRRSSLTTILGAQNREPPQMPGRDEALQWVDNYLKVIAPYIPIVHGPTFRKQVRLNDVTRDGLTILTLRDQRLQSIMIVPAALMTGLLKWS